MRGSLPRLADPPSIRIKGIDVVGAEVKAVSIRILAREMAEAGLDGFELQWIAGSMVLLAFPDLEAELVCVPAVEEREIDSGSEEGDSVQHGIVCGKGAVVSDGAIVGATRKLERLSGAVVTVMAIGSRGGVCSVFLDSGKADRELVVWLGDKVSDTMAVVGGVGAALVPIVRAVPRGMRKVKSVNSLVEVVVGQLRIKAWWIGWWRVVRWLMLP
ncbi:hypothetical protein V6N11_056073 [Hibiscus sabdariffa]|uniref:Uncharacterized protein n=1 Tax=Hibiscus sabdariffa TaxID=183260 RepID=A0ABR2T2R8_9ROSI